MNRNKRLLSTLMSMLMIVPMACFAGGIKGPLFSDELIYGFFTTLAILYLGSLCFGIIYANRGTVWCKIISTICTSFLFVPSLLVACFIPQIGIPSAIFTGLNYLLIRKKSTFVQDEEN